MEGNSSFAPIGNSLIYCYAMRMDTHSHSHHGEAYDRAFVAGIAINILFVAVEIAYGIAANSLSLLADAGHNAGDVLGLGMAWGATLLARRKPSPRFTYGLQSATIFAGLANGLLLMIAVGGIGWEAMQRFALPPEPASRIVIIVALAGVLVNGVTAWLFHGGDRHDLNIRGAFLHMAADALISLGVALTGFVILRTGWFWLDPLASLAIVMVIIIGTWRLLAQSVRLALHAVPAHIDPSAVRIWLAGLPGVDEVHDLHIWAMSTTGVALSAHLRMQGGHPGDIFLHEAAHELAHHFNIHHTTIQIETNAAGVPCETDCS